MASEDNFKVGKDNRNKGRIAKNRQLKKKAGFGRAPLSPDTQNIVIDVADSSDDSYCRREKTSNWSRYEEETEPDFTENEQMTAADFEFLQEHSINSGSHFTFSSEKEWENDTETFKTMNISYFNLKLSLLNAGLQTIPFYKRMDYNELLFPKDTIKIMDQKAEEAELKFKELIKNAEEDILPKKLSSAGLSIPTSPDNKHAATSVSEATNAVQDEKDDDDLEKLLSATESDLSNLGPIEKSVEAALEESMEKTETVLIEEKGDGADLQEGNKGDMQQWLDTVLDD